MFRNRLLFAIVSTLLASILLDIIVKESIGYAPAWLSVSKFFILIGVGIFLAFARKDEHLSKYSVVLGALVITPQLTRFIAQTFWWQHRFDESIFIESLGSMILLKFIQVIPIIALLLLIYKSPGEVYLVKGDLSVKAEKISWLGIDEDSISWGTLSVISALLISFGTLLLTLVTVTGFLLTETIGRLLRILPFIVLFALVNSFSEGVIFRSAVLGPLKNVLTKNQMILAAAVFFGMAHFYGVPRGVIGVVMSGILGWYMCRSMYETKGFLSSWIIHFMQDVVIFSMLFMTGGTI